MKQLNFSGMSARLLALLMMLTCTGIHLKAQGCSQPSNLTSDVLGSGNVVLSWSSIQEASSYTVQYRVGNTGNWTNGGTVSGTSQALSGLLPETVYSWRVKANCSGYSSVANFNTGGATGGNTACSQPSNLDIINLTPTSVSLSWSEIQGAFYYTVQYRVGNSGAWVTAGSVSTTSMTLINLLENTVYTWRVKASCSVYSSIATFNTGGSGGNTSCSQPSNLDALLLSGNQAELSWSAIEGAFNYTVQYRVGLAGTWITAGTVTGTSLILSNLLANTTYSWRVKASCSEYSSQAEFTTIGTSGGGSGGSTSCSAPSNTNTLAVFPNSAEVAWEAVQGALNYTVQYKLESGGSYITVGTFTTPFAIINGLLPSTPYIWRVKANCSPWGSDVQFSTPAALTAGMNSSSSKDDRYFTLYPNPTSSASIVFIDKVDADTRLLVYTTAGRMISSQILTSTQPSFDVSKLENGMYYFQLVSEAGATYTAKLVVNR